jgi:hypothetical protein
VRGCALAVGSFLHHVVPGAETVQERARAIPVEET